MAELRDRAPLFERDPSGTASRARSRARENRRGRTRGPQGGRRERLLHRGLPLLAALAGAGLIAGLVLGARAPSESEKLATRFVDAWERGDHAGMYREISPRSRDGTSQASFEQAYESARAAASATAIHGGEPGEEDGTVVIPMTVETHAFGTVEQDLRLPIEDGGVAWSPHLVFPGMPPGTELLRETEAPARAEILGRDGEQVADRQASAATSTVDATGTPALGRLGRAGTAADRERLYALGFPRDVPVGRSGLEFALEPLLAGTPGGRLFAGEVTLATSTPRPAAPVSTTVDSGVQEAAAAALAGRSGGVAALDPRTGEVRALVGEAVATPRPPGSTFKIATTTAALEAGAVKPSSEFPVRTLETVEGVDLDSVNQDPCGGTFTVAFAESCNPVFAKLGLEVGSERLVETAERYGFNRAPAIERAAASAVPAAPEIDPAGLALGGKTDRATLAETAIGQGDVRATPLQLASMSQTVAAGGARTEPTLIGRGRRPEPVRVTSTSNARTLERLMVGAVENGTGENAALGPGQVAGKTGTGQLDRKTQSTQLMESETDAWFTGYAPVSDPVLAVAVMLQRQGAGGKNAAPIARSVLQAGITTGD